MNPAKTMRFALLTLVAVLAVQSVAPACECCFSPRSPGFWMNHPDAWPCDCITIGDITYTEEEAIWLMKLPVKGDKRLTLFPALVAAELNRDSGACADCIASVIADADCWFHLHPLGCDSVGDPDDEVPANSDPWQAWDCDYCIPSGEALYECLDAYNNGRLWCAPKCEEDEDECEED